jgi:2-haloalkanoic acid dehalogenase type II
MTTPDTSRSPLPESVARVEKVLDSRGLRGRIRVLSDSTRTAQEAARAVSCDVAQIVKSIVFQGVDSHRPYLVLTSGRNQVDLDWVSSRIGERIGRADAEWVRGVTGYPIGGVPPLGHSQPLETWIDRDLLLAPVLWAAAGHPHAVFWLTPSELLQIIPGETLWVQRPSSPRSGGRVGPGPWFTFDVFGTLLDWKTSYREALQTVVGLEEATKVLSDYARIEQAVEGEEYRPYSLVLEEVAFRLLGETASQNPALRRIFREALLQSAPFPEVADVLRQLKEEGCRLAVLSNCDDGLLEEALSSLPVAWDLKITSERTRTYKPAPAHWIAFLRAAGVEPGEVVHVAGSPEYDLRTADRLGFHTIWVKRMPGGRDSPPARTRTVANLRDLLRELPLGNPS